MIQFDQEKFLKNYKFILLSIIVIILVLIATFLFQDQEKRALEKELDASGQSLVSKLVINEVMLSNGGAYADNKGKLYDWMELYNGSNHDINLKNYGLSDQDNKIKWVFPDTVIKAKSHLIIFLSGTKEEGLYAPFRLKSSGGEVLALKNANGKVIDALDTTALDKNEVLARDLKGNWFTSKKATPGYANTEEGYQSFQDSLSGKDDIKINEVLPRNDGNFKNADGIYAGYIEVINTGNKEINLEGYALSNEESAPFKWQFPNLTLKPNQTTVIYTTNMEGKESYSDFKLNSKEGVAILTNNGGKIVDRISYKNLANGMALVREKDTLYETSNISPGYPNTKEGRETFAKTRKNPKDLIINEVMNSNSSYLPQNGGQYYDWIELKNNTNKEISLKDYHLTTNTDQPKMWSFPDITLKPGQLYVVIASGDVNLSNNSYRHTNFKLSTIESLYLYKDSDIIDAMVLANIPLGNSMGKGPATGVYYFNNPTPSKENGTGDLAVAYEPELSSKPGVYNDVKDVKVELYGNGTIYYTLDGSVPNTSSSIYNGPIFLSKTAVIKAVNYESGKLSSPIVTGSYIVNEKHTLPVLSVSLSQDDFDYLERDTWNTAFEAAAYAELYEDGKSFSIPCGFKLFGGTTRGLPKKSFSLKFRKQYGAGTLKYQVFENRDFSEFNTLVIRSGSQDYEKAFIRDALMTSLVDGETNLDVQAYKSTILYINGNYWGIYNIREKVEAEFISNHYNVSKDKVDIVRIDNDINTGSNTNYMNLVNYMATHDLSVKGNYDYVKSKLNIESFIDFWVAEGFVTNNDIINTRFFSHPDYDGGRFHMIFYDLDYGMYNVMVDYFHFSTDPEGMSDFKVSTLMMRSLVRNSEFKQLYLERLSYQLKNVWTEARINAQIDKLYNSIVKEVPRNQERWHLSVEAWQKSIDDLRSYAKQRKGYMVSQAKSYFGLSNSAAKKYFGD